MISYILSLSGGVMREDEASTFSVGLHFNSKKLARWVYDQPDVLFYQDGCLEGSSAFRATYQISSEHSVQVDAYIANPARWYDQGLHRKKTRALFICEYQNSDSAMDQVFRTKREFKIYYSERNSNAYFRQLCFIICDTEGDYEGAKSWYEQVQRVENKENFVDPGNPRLLFKFIKGWESIEEQKSKMLWKINQEVGQLALDISNSPAINGVSFSLGTVPLNKNYAMQLKIINIPLRAFKEALVAGSLCETLGGVAFDELLLLAEKSPKEEQINTHLDKESGLEVSKEKSALLDKMIQLFLYFISLHLEHKCLGKAKELARMLLESLESSVSRQDYFPIFWRVAEIFRADQRTAVTGHMLLEEHAMLTGDPDHHLRAQHSLYDLLHRDSAAGMPDASQLSGEKLAQHPQYLALRAQIDIKKTDFYPGYYPNAKMIAAPKVNEKPMDPTAKLGRPIHVPWPLFKKKKLGSSSLWQHPSQKAKDEEHLLVFSESSVNTKEVMAALRRLPVQKP